MGIGDRGIIRYFFCASMVCRHSLCSLPLSSSLTFLYPRLLLQRR
jgi:hypothetical protein